MPAYFQENRFQTVSEVVGHASDIFYGRSVAKTNQPINFGDHYEVDYGQGGGAVVPGLPSREFNEANSSFGALDLQERFIDSEKQTAHDGAAKSITDQIAGQIPFRDKVTVTVTNPGEEGEFVKVEEGEAGPAMKATDSDVKVIPVYGRDFQSSSNDLPPRVSFFDGAGRHTVPVELKPRPLPSATPGNFVDKEPRGMPGRPEQQPADSRGDKDYPGYREGLV
jgi:hypothetical protein